MKDFLFELLKIDDWTEFWWISLGLGAQLAFASRFLVQWIASERAGRSYIPISFWYLSIVGGTILFAYAMYRQDVVFIIGQATGLIVYVRNLVLIHRTARGETTADTTIR